MLKLVHLSDLHFNAANARRVSSLLETVRVSKADHLVISGDLASSAHPEEFQGVRSLLDEHGFNDSERLTIIPGNHDIFGFIYQTFQHPKAVLGRARSVHGLAATASTLWQFRRKLMSYDAEKYLRDVRSFRMHFPHAFSRHIVAEGHHAGFPFAKLLPDDIALIGVDSNYFLPRAVNLFRLARMAPSVIRSGDVGLIGENLSGSSGYVNVESLTSLLEHPDVRHRRKILVMHHYLYSDEAIGEAMTPAVMREMRLDNRAETVRVIKDHGIEIVLHGHWHVTNAYRAGGARVLNSGGSLWSGFHQLDIHADRIRVTRREITGHVHM